MEPVFGLIPDDGSRAFTDLFSDFHGFASEFPENLFTGFRVPVVEGGQAVQEFNLRIAGLFHRGCIDLVGGEQLDTLRPDVRRFTHRDPHIRLDEITASHTLIHVFCQGDARPGFTGNLPGGLPSG